MYECAVSLYGPAIQELIDPIPVFAVKQACINDIRQEWAPKINDPSCLEDPAYQSKYKAVEWAKQQFGPRWHTLLTRAQNWKLNQPLKLQSEVIGFIQFCLNMLDEREDIEDLQEAIASKNKLTRRLEDILNS